MATQQEQGLLAQILVEVKSIAAEVSELKVANAQVIADNRHRAGQVDDHEARIRLLEAQQPAALTRAEFDEIEDERRTEADQSANRRIAWLALVFTVAQVVEGAFLYWLSVRP
jgi:hypothetical protein